MGKDFQLFFHLIRSRRLFDVTPLDQAADMKKKELKKVEKTAKGDLSKRLIVKLRSYEKKKIMAFFYRISIEP